jgi:hypothetical protein
MAFSTAAMALRGEALAKPDTTGVEDTKKDDVWRMMGVRYGLRAVGLRVEFYKKAAKDPMHARLLIPVLESNNDTAATEDVDNVLEKLYTHMATRLMKAAASLHATNAVKRSGDGGLSISTAVLTPRWLAIQQPFYAWRYLGESDYLAEPFRTVSWRNPRHRSHLTRQCD